MIVDNMPMPTSPNDESVLSPRLQAPSSFTEFLDGATLAPSPEHPAFNGGAMPGWTNHMDMSMNVDNKEYVQSTGLTADSSAQWGDGSAPAHPLSHVSSTSSLTSLFSMAPSNNSLLVDLPDQMGSLSHSRHSSFSYESKPDNDEMMMGGWTMPINPTPAMMPREVPALALQTQGLGKAEGRQRSMSRAMPYQRDRSMSLQSEDEEVGALLSTTSTHSLYTPWSAQMVNGLGKMSLHHRRTSSNTSAFSQNASPMRPSLSRAHRSGSLAIAKRASFDRFAEPQITGSAEERELHVRSLLADKANNVKNAPPGTQQDKLRTLWVRQWLHLCYKETKGYTVPRQGLYASYALSCDEYGVKAINSASFGKAVRNAYPNIKTRRLGHRGNSKYHYVALRPAIRLEAMRLNEYGDSSGQWHVAPEDGTMGFHPQQGIDFEGEDVDNTEIDDEEDVYPMRRAPSSVDIRGPPTRPGSFSRRHTTSSMPFSSFEVTPVYNTSGFPSIADVPNVPAQAQAFWTAYIQHLELLAGYVRALHFDQFEYQLRTFWAQRTPIDMEICQNGQISGKIDEGLAKAYDHYLSILLERLLSPLPQPAQNELRKLSNNLEAIIEQSMTNFSAEFCEPKIELSVRAGHLVNRYLDLYQMSTALAPILSASDQVRTMSHSWDHLDARSIADQCALSCNCKPELLGDVLNNFSGWLHDVESMPSRGNKAIEKLGKWIDSVLEKVTNLGVPPTQLITRVGFITSQVVRDFTLRSDSAFGLFQLVKTWIDDYVSLHLLRETALSSLSLDMPFPPGAVPGMSVMIPVEPHSSFNNDLSTAVPFTQALNTYPQPVAAHSNALGVSASTSDVNPGFGLPPSQFLLAPNGFAQPSAPPQAAPVDNGPGTASMHMAVPVPGTVDMAPTPHA